MSVSVCSASSDRRKRGTYLFRHETSRIEEHFRSAQSHHTKVTIVAIREFERSTCKRLSSSICSQPNHHSRQLVTCTAQIKRKRNARIIPTGRQKFARRFLELVHHPHLLRMMIALRRWTIWIFPIVLPFMTVEQQQQQRSAISGTEHQRKERTGILENEPKTSCCINVGIDRFFRLDHVVWHDRKARYAISRSFQRIKEDGRNQRSCCRLFLNRYCAM